MNTFFTLAKYSFVISLFFISLPDKSGAEDVVAIPNQISRSLKKFCVDCHQDGNSEGQLRLDDLTTLPADTQLTVLGKVQEQLFFGLMPPGDAEQPSVEQRATLIGSLSTLLRSHDASGLDEKLKRPEYGNFVDHDALFSGDNVDLPAFTYDRRWLISEFIFNAKVNDLLDHTGTRTIDGQRQTVVGDNGIGLGTRFGGGTLRQSIVNPFLLPKTIGVRYYDNTPLTRGHFLTMISNAGKIAAYMTSEQTVRQHYPAMYAALQDEFTHRETMRRRQSFLAQFIPTVAAEIFGSDNANLLPKFKPLQIESPEILLDNNGDPVKRQTNLGLLDRYERGDMQAIYLGIGQYRKMLNFQQIIRQCEQDWFEYGLSKARIRERVGIMKALFATWDMKLIYEDVEKKNIQSPEYKPLPAEEMKVITSAIKTHRKQNDTWQQIIDKCLGQWESDFDKQQETNAATNDEAIARVVKELYQKIFQREPQLEEMSEKVELTRTYLQQLNIQESFSRLIETMLLSSEFVYRTEFGVGQEDEHGRRMMSPREASYALAYALTDNAPDADLIAASEQGRLQTRDDYRREVIRMLERRDQYYVTDEAVQKSGFHASITNLPIRKLRFFREFFGYTKVLTLFKDNERFGAGSYDGIKGRLVEEADMLVAHILENDTNVFEELLTTEKFYVYHSGDNEGMKASADRLRMIYEYFKPHDWQNFTQEQLYKHWPFIKEMKIRGTVFADFETNQRRRSGWVNSFKRIMTGLDQRFSKGVTNVVPFDDLPMAYWHKGNATGRTGQVMRAHEVTTFFNIDYLEWDYPTTQPAKIENRKGMLTHPAWLIAHSQNTETDPVRRGKWVREKLLAGAIPDVPITVDAVIPEDHHKSLRQRLELKTGDQYCWKCHQKMDPLGLAFEMYDDFGRYRTMERLEHPDNLLQDVKQAERIQGIKVAQYKSLAVKAEGVLEGTGDDSLDGPVLDSIELVEKLALSARVRQSIIRHAFRYFLGRNETLSDSKTLIEAEQAYLENNGSFDAVIVSLLTSDSFIFRKSSGAP